MMKIDVEKTAASRISQVDFDNIPFGRVFSDHMLVAEYDNGTWGTPKIMPYQKLEFTPALISIHYGQSIFEGMKAFRDDKGGVNLFRPIENLRRLNVSAERMCMPEIPEDLFMAGLQELLKMDSEWVPKKEGQSLYIRPVYFASDEYVGVKEGDKYMLLIFTCPVGAYYDEPVKVLVEEEYTRAAPGGVGAAKTAGNYAASLLPAKKAYAKGYQQLIWTDAKEHKYIEEAGTMNLMLRFGDKLVTPALDGTILPGITRKSVLKLAKDWGMEVEERRISVEEMIEAAKSGELKEMFGVGTAATVTHVSTIGFRGENFELPAVETREFSNKVNTYLADLRAGRIEDPNEWILKVC